MPIAGNVAPLSPIWHLMAQESLHLHGTPVASSMESADGFFKFRRAFVRLIYLFQLATSSVG